MDVEMPNEKELEVLTLFYNRFYDLYDEITNDNFMNIDAEIRFFKLRCILRASAATNAPRSGRNAEAQRPPLI